MKKKLTLVSFLLLAGAGLYAQPTLAPAASPDWRVGANTANTNNVIGTFWNPGGGAAPQMWFTTGAAAPQYRMTIFGGGAAVNDGQIVMGNNIPAGFLPQSRLHLHQTGGPTALRFTNNGIGGGPSDGLVIGNSAGGFAFYQNFEPQQPHAFYTNDGSATGIFERMRINANSDNGFIGMGNSAGFTALSQLHINLIGANTASTTVLGEVFRTDGLSTLDNSWRMWTGTTIANSTQKGRLYASPTGNAHTGAGNPVDQNFNIEATQADMVFWANGTRPLGTTPLVERMRITSEIFSGANVTRVGISRDGGAVTDPRAMLHIGQPFNAPNTRGHRSWMDVGTYYSFSSDMMYVGQQQLTPQQNNAIIAWGSEPINFNNPNPPGDRLLFRFMDDPSFGNGASAVNGLEAARMVSDGNNARMSVGTPTGALIDPGNTLEIISSGASPRPAGLRFRNLNCASAITPQCSVTNPVFLSVDNNGDVILVSAPPPPPGMMLGNSCLGAPNPITSDWEIPLNTFNFHFTDPGGTLNDNENFVRIGGFCSNIPRGKLDVMRGFTNNSNSTVVASFVENSDISMSTPYSGTGNGVQSVSRGLNSTNNAVHGESAQAGINTGVYGTAMDIYNSSSNAIQNYGLQGVSGEGLINYGVAGSVSTNNGLTQNMYAGHFTASGSTASATLNGNYGVQSSTFNNNVANDNVGVYSIAYNFGTTTNNVGVAGISSNFGVVTNDIGVYGEGATAGYFAGPILTSMPPIAFSDQRIKENVQVIENGTEILKKLNPVTYNYKVNEYPELHLNGRKQYGFIAQEVEKVLPELVTESKKPEFKDKDGKVISKGGEFKGVNYDGIIPVLTQALKEQQTIIEKQEARLNQLEECINQLNLCKNATGNAPDNNGNTPNVTQVELSNTPSIVLEQNVPNPFAEQTTIVYTLTDEVQKAQMLFYNSDGKLINTVDLTSRGKGQLNVFANDLSNGVYTYTLVVDGKIIDSKRMIRNK